MARPIESADRLGVGHGRDRRLRDIGGDPRVPGIAAEPEEPQPRHQDDPRHRVELALGYLLARIVTGEIRMIFGGETVDRIVYRLVERIEPAGFGRGHDQRVVLGADRVIGGGHPGLAVAVKLGTIDVIEHRRV